MIVCTGKFTKKITTIQNLKKVYTGVITLGGTTASYDLETEINTVFETKHITKQLIHKTTKLFIGNVEQAPPIFSALKRNGERLYIKARRGEKIKIKKRNITIDFFKVTHINIPNINFEIKCSKGTYIRSIANDFGKELNNGGYLSKLCRTSIGEYKLKNAFSIKSLEKYLNN